MFYFLIIFLFISLLLNGILFSNRKKNLPYDGSMLVQISDQATKIFTLEIDTSPDDLPNKDHVIFKVVRVTEPEI